MTLMRTIPNVVAVIAMLAGACAAGILAAEITAYISQSVLAAR